mmetsp:Transcript_85842/g.142916  ORF Transcript_85842/g.142916 Transcript_85842/m.142916 type:complete len:83 (-) Transcript_85842:1429-1677(-)
MKRLPRSHPHPSPAYDLSGPGESSPENQDTPIPDCEVHSLGLFCISTLASDFFLLLLFSELDSSPTSSPGNQRCSSKAQWGF